MPVTLFLLLLAFGALIAAGLPVILAGSAVAAAVSLLAIPSRWLPVRSGTSEVVLILGMAVGVDYCLFYLRREREERAAGRSAAQALQVAAGTSGRAIVISGLTVMISLAGLFLSGIDLFTGMAFGTITVVGVSVAGSLTVLPALLSLLGDWSDRGRLPLPRPPDRRRPAVPAVGRAGPAGGAAPGGLGQRGAGRDGGTRAARARHADQQPGDGPAGQRDRGPDPGPDLGCVPRQPRLR